jgi:uncharacterized membrane protein required for colicin V production
MYVLWTGLAAVLLLTILGYRRGVLRIIAFIGALLLGGMAAQPLAGTFLPLVQHIGFIPRALLPVAAPLAAGLVVFIVLSCVASWLLRHRELVREVQRLPRLQTWEKVGGAALGAVWGCALVVLVVAGLHLLGRVEKELARENTSPPAPLVLEVQTPAAIKAPVPGSSPAIAPTAPLADAPVATTTLYQKINQQIDTSPLASVVQRVNPSEERIARIFGDLTTVTGDPVLLERFRNHPSIARLTALPQLKDAAQDPELQRLLESRQYYALLDHPKIAILLQDKALVAEYRKIDLEAVLAEARKTPQR